MPAAIRSAHETTDQVGPSPSARFGAVAWWSRAGIFLQKKLALDKQSTIRASIMGRTSDANERLMDAALDLIWEESYGAVTIDEICKRADVKKGSFYYFFYSKATLAKSALERMWAEH